MNNRGIHVFLVEDDPLVVMLLEEMLTDLGHEILDSAKAIKEATAIARKTKAELAMLDVNLGGESSFVVADILRKRRIPIVFLTGYGKAGIEARYDNVPVLSKPFDSDQLRSLIDGLFCDSSAPMAPSSEIKSACSVVTKPGSETALRSSFPVTNG